MKTYILTVMIIVSTFDFVAQNTTNEKGLIVNAEAAYIYPLGNLSNKFKDAQLYGFWFTLGEEKGIYCDIGISGLLLNKARNINYKFNDSIYDISSNNFGLELGIKASKNIITNKNTHLNTGIIFGIHYLDYKFPKDENSEKQNRNPYYFRNTTFLLSPQIKYGYKNVGIKLQYRFTPFAMLDDFEKKFGSHSLGIGVVYMQ